MQKILDVIWGGWEPKYFSENQKYDSTGNRPTGKSPHGTGWVEPFAPPIPRAGHILRKMVRIGLWQIGFSR
jgi:hypothetical protein